jgi:nicotinate dehydrogenase subunit A
MRMTDRVLYRHLERGDFAPAPTSPRPPQIDSAKPAPYAHLIDFVEDPPMSITLHVNGRPHTVDVDPATPLLYVLSDDLALRGPKFGCGLGQCGACTVILRGRAIRSCVTPVSTVGDADVTTLEGLGTTEHPHPIQQAFIDAQAAQCGFCLNGIILTAKAFVDAHPKATPAEIQQGLSGVLCRCFAHTRMLRAIHQYAGHRATEQADDAGGRSHAIPTAAAEEA